MIGDPLLTMTTPTSAPSIATQRTASAPAGYLFWAIWVMPTVLAATIRFGSSPRLAVTLANATAPTAPAMLVTCIGLASSFSSTSSLPTVRHVKSQPPPGLAGAMHSVFCGVKAISGRATAARPAMRPSLDRVISRLP